MALRLKPAAAETTAADQAAAWFARQRAGPWSETDAAEFAAWLRAEPAHTTAWTQYERLWGRLEAVRDNPTILAIREQARRTAERQSYWSGTHSEWRQERFSQPTIDNLCDKPLKPEEVEGC